MADRPILFSAPMVRALLAGRKIQTRRIITPQPTVHPTGNWSWEGRNGGFVGAAGTHIDEGFPEAARVWTRIQPGDVLWVREAWRVGNGQDKSKPRDLTPRALTVMFEAGGSMGGVDRPPRDRLRRADEYPPDLSYPASGAMPDWAGRLRASMHMPRWASRLTLTVTDVRVQRLQEISADDAVAEGVTTTEFWRPKDVEGKPFEDKWWDDLTFWQKYPQIAFRALWESINGTESWAANPWVAAYSFDVAHQNIDAAPAKAA